MNLQKHAPKIFAGIACVGVFTTTFLAIRATPKAMKAMADSGATTRKERVNAGWKYYIPTGASAVITVAAIIANHSSLVRENTKLALAYGFGQTALRLYSERVTPQVRQEISQQTVEQIKAQQPAAETILIDPASVADNISVKYVDYLSNRECYMTRNQIKAAIDEFTETYLKHEGKGSLNQLYSCFHNTAIEAPIGYLGETHGWKYVNEQGPIPLVSSGFDKAGLPCAVLDYVNPPQPDFSDEFA